jgi:hypothetical protein
MYGVVTADIVIPLITVTAIAIVFAIMAYLDKCEAEKERDNLENDFWQEHDFAVRLAKKASELQKELGFWQTTHDDLLGVPGVKKCLDIEIARLKAKGSGVNLRYDSQQTGQVANKNESENLADRYSSGYLHGNPALSRNVSNTDDGKQVGPRGQGVRRVPEVAAGTGPTPRTVKQGSEHDV